MELFQARDNFIIQDGYYSLWCNRLDGGIFPRQGVPPSEAFDPVCKGIVYGVIGKIQFFPGAEWKLLVITKRTLLGLFPGNHEAYRIDRIAVLPLGSGEAPELELDLCEKHKSGGRPKKLLGGSDGQQKGLQQTWKSIKSAATNMKENVKNTNTQKDIKDREKEKLEKRLLEETLKMFNDSDSFLYSPTGDIANTQQKQCGDYYDNTLPVWKRVDERFFWNKYMLQDLITNEDPLCSRWILPVIQGYCQIVHCVNMFEEEEPDELIEVQRGFLPQEEFDLILISRRCIHRAGTRYKRRGVDEDGEVANFVETEQIIRTEIHSVSLVQVRGSVPIYWSQPGFKYRPPPRLDKDENETQMAFMSHFAHQLKYYGGVVIINLIDQTGREKIIGDAFMEHIVSFSNPLLTYITFDFHEYCRGMKFENVSILVDSIASIIKDMRYCWTDAKGIICEQRSVFRINCMDCLDRTNVVQAALARNVMEVQLRKLGKLLPDQNLPADIRSAFQDMWANNGDAISRQYAGTAAMKGDFTRTGERRFTGLMKDGYNSANRYYLNRFKAVYRQTVIDAMLGNPLTEDLTAAMAALKNGDEEDPWTMEREECVAQLVIHCQWLLLAETEECLGGWALVDPFSSSDGELIQDQDVILLLTYDAYYIASYDDDAERITEYERISLEDMDKIEIGFEPSFKTRYLFVRIHHKLQGASGYFHTLRTIQHRAPEDARGVLLGIADAFATARSSKSLSSKINECKLDKKKSKPLPDAHIVQISSKSRLSGWSKPKTKVKNKHTIDVCEDESGSLSSKLRDKKSSGKLPNFFRHRLSGMPRPHSDPCLARQDIDDDFKQQRKRSGTSSAPLSSASSSSSSESDTDDAFVNLNKPLKSATKIETRSEERLVETTANEDTRTDVGVGESEMGVGESGMEVEESAMGQEEGVEESGVGVEESGVGVEESGMEVEERGMGLEESEIRVEESGMGVEDSGMEEHRGMVVTPDLVSDSLQHSTEMDPMNEIMAAAANGHTEDIQVDVAQGSQGDAELDRENSKTEHDGDLLIEFAESQHDDLENEVQRIVNELIEITEKNGEIYDDKFTDKSTCVSTNSTDTDHDNVDSEKISEIRESYNESKRKLRDDNLDVSNIQSDSFDTEEEDEMSTAAKQHSSPLVRLGIRGSSVSFKSSSSTENSEKTLGNSELEGEVVSGDAAQGFDRSRYSGGLLSNQSPDTNRSTKTNIFASAQARGRTLLPDLRNKLSSISFPRTRSPRLMHKQHSVSTDTVGEHKRHKHRKCLTQIIEL